MAEGVFSFPRRLSRGKGKRRTLTKNLAFLLSGKHPACTSSKGSKRV